MKKIKTLSFILLFCIFTIVSKRNVTNYNIDRSTASVCNDLESRLEHKFNIYKKAQGKLIDIILKDNSYISRSNWEQLLESSDNCNISATDIAELKDQHKKAIEEARKKAAENSVINLSDIKKDKNVSEFCAALPKGGVQHLHPSGVLDVETLNELGVSRRELSRFFIPDGKTNFQTFDRVFSPLRGLLGSGLTNNLKYGISKYLERARKQGVIYVEFGKLFDANSNVELTLNQWAKEFYDKYDIVVKWKVGFIRVHGGRTSRRRANSLIEAEYKYRKSSGFTHFSNIVGVDLYGNENGYGALETSQALYIPLYAMKNSLHPKGWTSKLFTTMHSGEFGDKRNPRDAMIMGVDRIGHGVALKDRIVDLEFARRYNDGQGLPIEVNLVSNYRLNSIDKYKNHPFLDFLRLGLPISFNTDDEGIFKTTINDECEMAIKHTDIQYSELKAISYNSIHHSFIHDEKLKSDLVEKLDNMFLNFESEWVSKD